MESYPKIYHVGHRYLEGIFSDPVLVEEKVDGSQFSFGRYLVDGHTELRCRSKGAEINIEAPEKMFVDAVNTAKNLFPLLFIGWTYRCEYLQKPKHNVLAYDRTPDHKLIILDISLDGENYLTRKQKEAEAERLELEIVPVLYEGVITSPEQLRDMLSTDSILGGQKVEGVVVKNYTRFGVDGKALFAKFVSESFKESHKGDWRERNPKQGDIITQLITRYRTPARWQKAVQHLRERGELEQSPKDIGKLITEAGADLETEEKEEIKEYLWKWAWSNIRRGTVAGLPEWYKEELLKLSFETGEVHEVS